MTAGLSVLLGLVAIGLAAPWWIGVGLIAFGVWLWTTC
jgi:hypothetical protein